MKRYYVIDIGTNSSRLLCADISSGRLHTVYKKLITCRTGEGVDRTGMLSMPAVHRTMSAVSEFMKMITEGCHDPEIICYATSAVRDSSNREILADAIKDRFGIELEILSGQQEAEYGYTGALNGRAGGIIDIGGGSTEIIYGNSGAIEYETSLQLGCIRSLERYESEDATYDAALNMFKAISIPEGISFTGVGGTITTFAAIDQKLETYDRDRINGYILRKASAERIYRMLSSLSPEERTGIPGLQPKRADIIGYGGAILLAFMDSHLVPYVDISDSDGMEGILIRRLGLVN